MFRLQFNAPLTAIAPRYGIAGPGAAQATLRQRHRLESIVPEQVPARQFSKPTDLERELIQHAEAALAGQPLVALEGTNLEHRFKQSAQVGPLHVQRLFSQIRDQLGHPNPKHAEPSSLSISLPGEDPTYGGVFCYSYHFDSIHTRPQNATRVKNLIQVLKAQRAD